MEVHLKLTTVLIYTLIKQITPSVTGLTYMDNFNFEERYRNENECNPLYWHPLHLPERCLKVYEKLMKSRLGWETSSKRSKSSKWREYSDEEVSRSFEYEPTYPRHFDRNMGYPYDDVMRELREDIRNNPRGSELKWTKFGLVTLYNQPVSKKTGNLIKQMANLYSKRYKNNNANIFYPEKNAFNDNNDGVETKSTTTSSTNVVERMNGRKKHKFMKKKIKNGVAYIMKSVN